MKPQTKPFTVEIRGSRKGSTPWPAPAPAPVPTSAAAQAVFTKPASAVDEQSARVGRILPALELTPSTADGSPRARPERQSPRGRPTARQAAPVTIPNREKVEVVRSIISDVILQAAIAHTAISPIVREERDANEVVSRKSFRRGKRWMYRLPAVINRKHVRS